MGRPRTLIDPGDRFEMLVVIKEANRDKYGNRRVFCKCDCGNKKVVNLSRLTSKETKSCGCLRSKMVAQNNTTHGMSKAKIYRAWHGIKDRCLNHKNKQYHDYGGRGINICAEWLDFNEFYDWAITNGYKENLTIERIDNNSGYSPDNCTWIKKERQSANRRICRKITYKGKTKNLSEWCRSLCLNRDMIKYRIDNGWDVNKAFETPSRKQILRGRSK